MTQQNGAMIPPPRTLRDYRPDQLQEIVDVVMKQMAIRHGSSRKRDFEVATLMLDALLAAEGRHEENDHSAELIHQAIPDVAETEPRLNKERCVCAAVLIGDRIVPGYRHHHAIKTAVDAKFTEYVSQGMQGFLTNSGRYVSRVEGLELQLAAGIPSARGRYGVQLTSEDLY